jgi:hypothetical protein
MTSARRIVANRRNAQRSRGPRTPAGKACVARNALRHGLAVNLFKNPKMFAEVDRLARALAGGDADDDDALLAEARIVAEAELDFERFQEATVSLMNLHQGGVRAHIHLPGIDVAETGPQNVADGSSIDEALESETAVQPKNPGTAMLEMLPQLVKLKRYGARARSRRKKAMRRFLAEIASSDR